MKQVKHRRLQCALGLHGCFFGKFSKSHVLRIPSRDALDASDPFDVEDRQEHVAAISLAAHFEDRLNRLTQRAYPDALNDTFAYDLASRLTSAVSGRYNNVVSRTWDAGSRMTSESLTIGGQTFPVASAYDAANRRRVAPLNRRDDEGSLH